MIIIVLIIVDQWTKGLAERLIGNGKPFTVIEGFFQINCIANRGAAWSIFSNHDWGLVLLIVLSTLVMLALLWLIKRAGDTRAKAVLILLIAGSAGNLIDRLRQGAVTDFLSFSFGSYTFPTFNVADAMITVGTGLLILFALLDRQFLSVQFGAERKAEDGGNKKKE